MAEDLEKRVTRLEERIADLWVKLQELQASASRAVEVMARTAKAAEDFRGYVQELLAVKESRAKGGRAH